MCGFQSVEGLNVLGLALEQLERSRWLKGGA